MPNKPRNRGGRGRTVIGTAKDGLTLGKQQIEFDGSLNYTIDDPAVNQTQRPLLTAWEKKREGMKIEYANAIGYNGSVYGEVKGGKNSVRVPYIYHANKGSVFTHIHPREDGLLGGTFSTGDMKNFSNGNNATFRAVAKEGTYSISKGKNFNANGFMSYYKSQSKAEEKKYNAAQKQISNDVANGKMDYNTFVRESNKAFNNYLLALHNTLDKGQQIYGYHYYLERR